MYHIIGMITNERTQRGYKLLQNRKNHEILKIENVDGILLLCTGLLFYSGRNSLSVSSRCFS